MKDTIYLGVEDPEFADVPELVRENLTPCALEVKELRVDTTGERFKVARVIQTRWDAQVLLYPLGNEFARKCAGVVFA